MLAISGEHSIRVSAPLPSVSVRAFINYFIIVCDDEMTCSGNGTCDTDTGFCKCFDAYNGTSCSECSMDHYGPSCSCTYNQHHENRTVHELQTLCASITYRRRVRVLRTYTEVVENNCAKNTFFGAPINVVKHLYFSLIFSNSHQIL